MISHNVCDLADCSEFRQTLASKSPALMHASTVLLMLLLVAAVVWAALVEADLVVQATGRVRPVEHPARVFAPAGEHLDGRVAEVHFEEGDRVNKGQLLARLDTQRLENEIARLKRTIATCREEISEIERLDELTVKQFASAKAKAEAEWNDARNNLERATADRASRVRQAEAEVAAATETHERLSRLAIRSPGAVSQADLTSAESELLKAREALARAKLPVDNGEEVIHRRALELVADDFAVRRAELSEKQVTKRGEAEAADKQLASLLLLLQRAELRSPLNGVVVAGRMKVGDILEAGKPAVEIALQDGFHFEAAVPSSDVGELRRGMPVKIKFDAYDHQRYGTMSGTVCYISPDSQPVDPESEHAGTVAYRVRVKLDGNSLSRGNLRGRLKLGLAGTAEIVTDRRSILAILFHKIRGTVSLN